MQQIQLCFDLNLDPPAGLALLLFLLNITGFLESTSEGSNFSCKAW